MNDIELDVLSDDGFATDRPTFATLDLAVRLWVRAKDLHDQGNAEAAREAALDATAVWAIARSSIEIDVLLELLVEVCGDDAAAILAAASHSASLAAWSMGPTFRTHSVPPTAH